MAVGMGIFRRLSMLESLILCAGSAAVGMNLETSTQLLESGIVPTDPAFAPARPSREYRILMRKEPCNESFQK